MRILACVVHFFGSNSHFQGGSTVGQHQAAASIEETMKKRLQIVLNTCDALRKLADHGLDVDVKICGIEGKALLPIDWDFSGIEDPTCLVYETIQRMLKNEGQYDFVMCIEDDIVIPAQTMLNVLRFEDMSLDNEVLHPTRVEILDDGKFDAIDLRLAPGWTQNRRSLFDRTFSVALNPHSGLCIFSKRKAAYASEFLDPSFRERFYGGRMASAFANVHKPFLLWRCRDDPLFHHVIHQDRWSPPAGFRNSIKRLSWLARKKIRAFLN